MKKQLKHILIGTIFIASMIAIVAHIVIKDNKDYTLYQSIFNNADGIYINTPVFIAGIQIGYVKDIALETGQTKVVLHIKNNIKIPKDSILQIETPDFYTPKSLIIAPGFEEEYIKNGEYFQYVQNSIDFIGLLSDFLTKRVNDKKEGKQNE